MNKAGTHTHHSINSVYAGQESFLIPCLGGLVGKGGSLKLKGLWQYCGSPRLGSAPRGLMGVLCLCYLI